ncbi:hypothetical protein ACWGDX_29705 [Streptomyces sp. NPDC055025]
MNFLFVCGCCGAECVLWGKPVVSWWTDKYWLPDDFECWDCGENNSVPPPPWTSADD